MQKSGLSLEIEFDTPSLCVPYGERPPTHDSDLVKAQEPDANDNDVVLRGRIIASSSDAAGERASAFELKEAHVSFTTRTLLARAGLDNRSVLDVYHQPITLFAADDCPAVYDRQTNQLGPVFNELSSSLFTSISIPFKFCLPNWLPPSLVTSHTKVVHTVSAKIKYTYSQKSISAVILGRALTNVHKAQRDVPVRSCAPLSHSPSAVCLFSNASTSKQRDFSWKVQAPRCTNAGSHVDLLLKFTILPAVAREMVYMERARFDIVQEKTKVWDVHDKSPWRVVTGKREDSESFLIGAAKRTEKSKEYPLTPLEVPFQPAPPPPPPPPSSNRSPTQASETEVYYALRVCLSLRGQLLPSCNTPFLKVSHKIRVALQLATLGPKQKEIYTIMVPITITNDRISTNASSSPEPDAGCRALAIVNEAELSLLPSYDEAVVESQMIHVLGPVTRRISSANREQLTKLQDFSEESLSDQVPDLQL
ncbi:hypothetical protein V1517DRAFT_314069 [Lipomyces orientalis]|uniref:Uncharacterized protein n=1 Tax=Lipomyces orientalis TaxID=1233043 RepID=A0ACC3TY54_9ASCO